MIVRHAKSKLTTFDDLLTIPSYGFRGEALASICKVAGDTIISRTMSSSVGYKIIVQAANGKATTKQPIPTARTVGTTI